MLDKEIIIEKVKDEYSELAKGASECCGVREAARIFRSGGRMHISDVILRSILPTNVVADMDNWTQCIAGAELLDNYINMMVDAGFSSVGIVSDKPFKAEGDEGWMDSVRSINILAVK